MHRLTLPVLLILLALGAASTGVSRAQEQRLYAGVTALASQLGASVDKRVDTRAPGTLVPEPRRGRLLHDRDTGETTAYGPGLLAGYRHPVIGNALYVGVEVDVAFDSDAVQSQFQGIGESAGRNQLGESWPDHWDVRQRSQLRRFGQAGRGGGPVCAPGTQASTRWWACAAPMARIRRVFKRLPVPDAVFIGAGYAGLCIRNGTVANSISRARRWESGSRGGCVSASRYGLNCATPSTTMKSGSRRSTRLA